MLQEKFKYYMPAEWEPHEGTWLQWPHDKTFWGEGYRSKLEPIWITMVKELHLGERVHIIAHNEEEAQHVELVLTNAGVQMENVDVQIKEIDDVWVRDDGPIFVKDEKGDTAVTDWNFNGWGKKYPYEKDRQVPEWVGEIRKLPYLKGAVCLEGGGIEVDGQGTLMAAKTSILGDNRNPGLAQTEVEAAMAELLGITNFVWITGVCGADNGDEDTDFHIDGAARFTDSHTVLMECDPYGESEEYLLKIYERHFEEIRSAKATDGKPFRVIPVPVTRKIVEEAGSRGSYLNYYVGNEVVLVPVYGDENDELGLKIIEGQFQGRRVIGIDVCQLFQHGGMLHCVTQQQPR